jgi:hypothetical protein
VERGGFQRSGEARQAVLRLIRAPRLLPPNIQHFVLKRNSLGWPTAAPFRLAHHFPKTFSGWLTFYSRKKNIFEEKIVLKSKRLSALKRNPEIGRISEQTFQVLE